MGRGIAKRFQVLKFKTALASTLCGKIIQHVIRSIASSIQTLRYKCNMTLLKITNICDQPKSDNNFFHFKLKTLGKEHCDSLYPLVEAITSSLGVTGDDNFTSEITGSCGTNVTLFSFDMLIPSIKMQV